MIRFPPSSHLPLLKADTTTKFAYTGIPPSELFQNPHLKRVMEELLAGLVALTRNIRKHYPDVDISTMNARFQVNTSKTQVDQILQACTKLPLLSMVNSFNFDSFFQETELNSYLFHLANEALDQEDGQERKGEDLTSGEQLRRLRIGLQRLTTRNIPPSILAQHGIFQVEYSKAESTLLSAHRHRKDTIRADGTRQNSTPDLSCEMDTFAVRISSQLNLIFLTLLSL